MSLASSLLETSMGLGLKALNRFASLPAFAKDPAFRKKASHLLTTTARTSVGLRGIATKPFRGRGPAGAAGATPARLPQAAPKDLFDLNPTEEQAMVREAVAGFASAELRPAALDADTQAKAPAALLKQAADLGLITANLPEDLGGAATDRSVVGNALVAEALAHGDLSLALAIMAPVGVAGLLTEFGSTAQQSAYLGAFAGDNPPQAALAVQEPVALFDPFTLATRAARTAAGYVLNGEKSLVPLAADAELFVVAAELEGKPALFIVESGAPGLAASAEPAMGLRAAGTGRLVLNNVAVDALALLEADYPRVIGLARLGWCALAVGACQAVLDYCIPYVNERTAFGEPISHRQSVAFMISDISIELEALRLATYRAAARAEAGKEFLKEAAVARSLCQRHAMKIGSDGVQLLGGHGFVKEHPVERWYRDLRAAGMFEGGLML